jgi:DNA-binding transcriptional LysR family regulator
VERHRKVAALWNWLPAFRGVAEYESIHKAATELAVSPSALSRSVRLLEDALGHALFARQGARLKLTGHGQELFMATKEAMRRIDDTIALASAVRGEMMLTVAASSPMVLALAETAALQLLSAGSTIRVRALLVPEEDGHDELLRGGCDLLLSAVPESHIELTAEALGDLHCALFAAGDVDDASSRFVAVVGQSPDPRLDQSGANAPVMEVSSVAFSCDVVRAIQGSCLLPELVLSYTAGLVRNRRIATLKLHGVRRKPVTPDAMPMIDAFTNLTRQLLRESENP